MNGLAGWADLAVLAVLVASAPGVALAEGGPFNDCMDPGYLAGFADAPTADGLTCIELFRFEVATPDGPRQIRAIADAGSDWAAPPEMIAEVERGARLAGAAFASLGRFSVDNITLLVLDDVHPTSDLTGDRADGEILGVTLSDRAADMGRRPECLVTIYALADGAADGSMPVTVAHEIFHCVQGASYAGPKYQSYAEGGAWWIEGAAEAFAAAAVPDSAAFTDHSGDFDHAVAGRVALDLMQHEAVQFFYWQMQTQGGLAALMPFQDAMAETGGRAAQHAAMTRALAPDAWQTFAEAYADGTISHPQGGRLASSPPEGTVMTFDASGRETLPLEPFAISLGKASYGCGLWGNTAAPAAPQMTWKPADAGESDAWRALPEEIDTREGRDTDWRFVTMPVGDSPTEGEVETERRSGCNPCMGIDKVDACLIGTWAMSGGGPAEWMRAQGFPGTVATSGEEEMTLRADGIFSTVGFSVSADESRNGVTMEGDGSVAPAHGAWSADAGVLNFCAGVGGMSGTVTVTTEDGSGSGSVGAGAGNISMSYSCAGSNLSTTIAMRGLPDMVTEYVKVSE